MLIPKILVDAFWERHKVNKVVRRAALGPCWESTFRLIPSGYAVLGVPKLAEILGTHRAHRAAYMISKDLLLASKELVCHHCDNPACIRPRHLFQGTYVDNAQDMYRKGRQGKGSKVLTEQDVAAIRKRYVQGGKTQTQLGIEYGVSQTAIRYIVIGKTWLGVE